MGGTCTVIIQLRTKITQSLKSIINDHSREQAMGTQRKHQHRCPPGSQHMDVWKGLRAR